MVKVNVYDKQGNPKHTLDLPQIFKAAFRPDIIKRAVIAQQSHRIQPQGRDRMAGKRTTAITMGTGFGTARIPRVKGSHYPRAGQGGMAPSTVGGRRTHPPKPEKKIFKCINKKERLIAIRSAIAATSDKSRVASRGHILDNIPELPLVVTDDVENIHRSSEARELFEKLGLKLDLNRVKRSQKIRAGKGKMRGRRRRHGVGPLFVINEDKGIRKAVRNFSGVNVLTVDKMDAGSLAPGTIPGRLTIWVSSAFKKLDSIYMKGG